MVLPLIPGILFDPREPIPPGFENYGLHLAAQADVQFHDPRYGRPDPAPQVHSRRSWLDEHEQHEQPRQRGFLSPLSATVNIQIVHDTAKFTVTHLFRNQSSAIKQGAYQFPLPLEATVTEFSCRIGTTRIIRGKVKPKEDARRDFDNAVRQDRTGGLVEQQTAEVFTTTLGNIPPNTEMRAELSFVCLLKHRTSVDREVFTLIVPTYIAPRYGDLPPGVQAGNQGLQFLDLEVDLLTAEELVFVNSDTHIITYQRGTGQRPCQRWEEFIMHRDDPSTNLRTAVIKLEEGRTTLDKDLVLTIHTALADNAETPQACLEIHPRFVNHKAVMLTLPSNFMLQAETFSHDGEIIFVADRSGSMSDKIESLKSAMMFFINGIPENRPFNIWCFGSNFTSMWKRSRAFNEASKRKATDYVRKRFASDMGGTEILPALQAIYNARGGYHSMDVIVLTDGQIWKPAETINFVKTKWKMSEGMIRFFSLGIGAAVSHELVEGIAKAGGGYAEVITSTSGGGWEDRIVAVLKAATTGHIGSFQMELEWKRNHGFEGLQLPMYQQSPVNVSAISPFIRNRVFILFDSGSLSLELEAVVLKARGANGVNVTKRVPLRQLHLPDSTIHKLAVRALLGDLERGDSRLHQSRPIDATQATFDRLVRDEAVNLGCKWSLVSKWTSLYAVEEEVAEPNDEGMDLDFEDARANDELGDALLLPRGALNLNAGRLLAGAGAGAELEESGSETDSTDSEPRPRFGGRPGQGDDSDDDSDGGHNNPRHGAGGGNAGDAGMDTGSGDNGHGELRERDSPRDGVPRDDAQGHSGRGNNLDRTSFSGAESAEPTPTEFGLVDWSHPVLTAQQSQGWESTASGEPIMPSGPSVPASPVQRIPLSHSSSYSSLRSPRSRSTRAGMSDQDPRSYGSNTKRETESKGKRPHEARRETESKGKRPHEAKRETEPKRELPHNTEWETQLEVEQLCNSSGDDSVDSMHAMSVVSAPIIRPETTSRPTFSKFPDAYAHVSSIPDGTSSSVPTVEATTSPFTFSLLPDDDDDDDPLSSYRTFAPVFNPPASTSLLQNVGVAAKTAEETAAEEFVRGLLVFQKSDGCFAFSNEKTVKTTLGSSFLSVVTGLEAKLDVFDTIVTIALVALLEEQFQICQALWVLMVRKAKDYISACSLGPSADALMQEARNRIKSIPSVMQEIKNVENAVATAIELEIAPIV